MNPPPRHDSEEDLNRFLNSAFQRIGGEGTDLAPAVAEPESETDEVPERLGRYAVAERIGQGGIGLVYRVSDPDLGRDLAIKILKSAHASNVEITSRFLDEARVCSRLQHPGVVPIHEMGQLEDGRPYFTMKIVDGHTLSRLLRDRDQPGRDEQRFLEIFERICQTLAFVHSHGVTHGDLKPQNVMIGTFGEVQVMDWGFAHAQDPVVGPKPSSDRSNPATESGSSTFRVIGTPAYMSPEQARGDQELIGPGTDVFGLGAILCEILTDAPPHLGDTRAEVLLLASNGCLDDARERLLACGADPALMDLCLRCLAHDPKDRPEDAGVVARETREYLSSLEERARILELEATEARAVATQERRIRRLTVALGVAALLAVIVPGAIHLKNVQERARRQASRQAETESSIARWMERARLLLPDEGIEAAIDLEAFADALKAAQEAEILATTPDANPGTLRETRDLISEVARQRDRAAADATTDGILRNLCLRVGDGGVRLRMAVAFS